MVSALSTVSPKERIYPRKVIREEIASWREALALQEIQVWSELPARLPTALRGKEEPLRTLFHHFLKAGMEHGGIRELTIRLDWDEAEAEKGEEESILLMDLLYEGKEIGAIESVLKKEAPAWCAPMKAAWVIEANGSNKRRAVVKIPATTGKGPTAERLEPKEPLISSGSSRDTMFAQRHPFQVLVVDDSAIARKLTSQLLRNLGYEPVSASNGLEAVSLALEKKYRLIFMDLRMPEMDGREATQKILQQWPEGTPRPFVVALTAEISEAERKRCLEAGMSAFLTKPCRPDDLAETIRTLGATSQAAVHSESALNWEKADPINPATLRALQVLPGTERATLFEELVDSLYRETPAILKQFPGALEKKNWPLLRHQIHQLTGNFEVMGALRLGLLCRACSKAVQEAEAGGNAAEAGRLLGLLEGEFKVLKQQLEAKPV